MRSGAELRNDSDSGGAGDRVRAAGVTKNSHVAGAAGVCRGWRPGAELMQKVSEVPRRIQDCLRCRTWYNARHPGCSCLKEPEDLRLNARRRAPCVAWVMVLKKPESHLAGLHT